MTFGEFWPTYFKKKELMVKRSTLGSYDMTWHGHLKERFHDVEMDDIKPSDIQSYIDDCLRERKWSIKTVHDHIVLIKNILKTYAITHDLPTREYPLTWPTKNIKGANSTPREKFTEQELTKLMDYCKNSSDHFTKLVALAAMTGLRIGEASGIQFGDFDFDKKTLHIQRTVERIYFAGSEVSELTIGSPKTTNSKRTVPVPPWLCSYYKAYQKLLKFPDEAFVLTTRDGIPMEPRTMRTKYYQLCDKIGIRRLTFHCLRHTYASRLILSKADIRTVSELLGHSDVTTTLNIYAHSDEDKKASAARKIFM